MANDNIVEINFTSNDPVLTPFYRGDTLRDYSFNLTEVGGDWTGTTVKIQWRVRAGQPPFMSWDLSVGSGTVEDPDAVSHAVNGLSLSPSLEELTIPMEAPKEAMQKVVGGSYAYDVEITLASGVTETYFRGTIEITDDITRP
jgi:hypothetical protein